MQEWVSKNGLDDGKALLDYAYALATHYGEAIGALACQMYEETAAAQNVTVAAAEAASTPEYGEVAKAVNGAKKQSTKLISSAVGRLVKQVGADTTLKNAQRDGAQFAWIPHGDTCAFCLTLASRGWQYMSKNTLKNGHAEHIHANCDCEYSVRFDGSSTVEGYDPDKYLEMYNNAEGSTPNEKINSMRRTITAYKRTGNMSTDEYTLAKAMWKEYDEVVLDSVEKEHVYEELDNNLSAEEKASALVRRPIGDYYYTAINKGHNQYKIIKKESIDGGTGDSLIDEVLDEVLDSDWRNYL